MRQAVFRRAPCGVSWSLSARRSSSSSSSSSSTSSVSRWGHVHHPHSRRSALARTYSAAAAQQTVGLLGACREHPVAQRLEAAGLEVLLLRGTDDEDEDDASVAADVVAQGRAIEELASKCDIWLALVNPEINLCDFYGIANNSVEGHDLDVGSTAPHEGDGATLLSCVKPGDIVIDCSVHTSWTDSASGDDVRPHLMLQQLAAELQARGAVLIDATVPLHPTAAASSLFVAGPKDAIESATAVLHCIPDGSVSSIDVASQSQMNLVRCGPRAGAAAAMQLCTIHQQAILMVGWAEVVQMAKVLGVPTAALEEASSLLPPPTIHPTIDLNADADVESPSLSVNTIEGQLRTAVELAREHQSPVPLGALTAQLYTLVDSGGFGDMDYSVVRGTIYGEHEAGSDEGELTVETLQASLNAIEAINDEAQSDPSKPTSFTS